MRGKRKQSTREEQNAKSTKKKERIEAKFPRNNEREKEIEYKQKEEQNAKTTKSKNRNKRNKNNL